MNLEFSRHCRASGIQHDCHIIFTEISARLDFVSAIHIRAGMIDLFNEKNPEFRNRPIGFINEKIGG